MVFIIIAIVLIGFVAFDLAAMRWGAEFARAVPARTPPVDRKPREAPPLCIP